MLDTELRQAADGFEFNRYLRLLTDFAQEDLSAFFFDIRKDSLYCDAPADPKRRAYRTVLDTLFHALVRYAAPILCFTAEEVWQARYPSQDGSVHFLEWPELPSSTVDAELVGRWHAARGLRRHAGRFLEDLRREKQIGSSLEAELLVRPAKESNFEALQNVPLAEVLIVSSVKLEASEHYTMLATDPESFEGRYSYAGGEVGAEPTTLHKCGRCWRHLPEVGDGNALCARCTEVVHA
jgi:isoleucyl-tRNA synthetase